MRRSARPQLAPPPPRRRLHRLQATPVLRYAESSCTSPAALPCAEVGVQEPPSRLFVAGTTTSSLTGGTSRRQACGRLHPSHTRTHIPTPSALAPSALAPWALVPSNTNTFGPCTFGPCALGPRAFLELDGGGGAACPDNARKITLPAFLAE